MARRKTGKRMPIDLTVDSAPENPTSDHQSLQSRKDIFSRTVSTLALFVSVVTALWGDRLLERYSSRLDVLEERIQGTSEAPRTETPPGPIFSLSKNNISLADSADESKIVAERLRNHYSGYPALIERLHQLLGQERLQGNAVPLTMINASNLKLHGRGTNEPIIDPAEIKLSHLERALLEAWREKNTSLAKRATNLRNILAK